MFSVFGGGSFVFGVGVESAVTRLRFEVSVFSVEVLVGCRRFMIRFREKKF